LATVCAACGTSNPEGARFCRRCGAAISPSVVSPPAAQAPLPAASGARWVVFLVGVLLGAAAAGGGAWTWLQAHKAEVEQAATRQAEARLQAALRAERKRFEEIEQAKIDAEQQASHAAAVQQAATREAEMTKAELKAAAARAAKEAQARKKEEERLKAEAAERKRLEDAAAAASASRTPVAAAPRPQPLPPPVPAPATQTAQASPEALCRSMTNFITRGICETRECIKPQYVASDYCRSLRARAAPPLQP
jgi:hypothetical protein